MFIGWKVPDASKPIYSKVDNMTMTRYEGATEMYATYVDLQDKDGKYDLPFLQKIADGYMSCGSS